ncbi:MAG: TIGR03960 family B12-binding radical SAM protein [Desulfarculaceae bacterium]|jgi:radical SAM family uncharacterized protein/radical SAM-linked protein
MDRLIAGLQHPARYLGGEAGQVVKDPSQVRLTLALAFPEVYEIAMSHLGLKIIYEALAPRPEVAAERVFAPWLDLMSLMQGQGFGPWSLESGRPLNRFDVIGFSFQYELTYTNALHMLRLAGIPLRREERRRQDPVVIGGGPCMVNPEPMAEFLDLAVVGEAEELIGPLVDLFIQAKDEDWDRDTLYRRAADLEGIYAPALFRPHYRQGRLLKIEALDPKRSRVRRRIVADLKDHPIPVRPVVPSVKPVHDRLGLEVARGCTRGCRFCQAGYIYRPVRERDPQAIMDSALQGLERTGFEELALLSLSAGDYSCIEELAGTLMDRLAPRRISLSLPSLRVDTLSQDLAAQIKRVRKTGFTLAPEAGSERLRRVINKNLSQAQILEMARGVFALGWKHIKLYFMLGLPSETPDDVKAIGRLCGRVAEQAKSSGNRPVVNASLGLFVPKPHTPFQWEGQMDLDQAQARLDLARSALSQKRVRAKWNSPPQSVLEGVLSRGDRRLAPVLESVVEAGCCFDGWSEHCDFEAWIQALHNAGLSLQEYLGPRDLEGVLPWDHIDVGVSKQYLRAEREKALAEVPTGDCRQGRCLDCGVCDQEAIKTRLADGDFEAKPAPPVPMPQGQPLTYRFQLQKTGAARFLGHLEMMTSLARAFRRAGIDLAHSQGYHPHPLVKTGSALPLGVESLVEVLEVSVLKAYNPEELADRVNKCLPGGLSLSEGRLRRPGERLREPEEVTYRVLSQVPLDAGNIDRFVQSEDLEWVRTTPKGSRTINLKAAVKSLDLDSQELTMVVGKAGGRPKPAEVLQCVFGLSPEQALAARALKIRATWAEG